MSRDAVQHEPIGGLAAESVLHVVRVRWVEHDVDDPDVWVAHEADLSLRHATSLMQALASSVNSVAQTMVRDALAGDCDQCHNVRMVEQPAHGGRTEQVHCPACWPLGERPVPTFEVFADVERRLYPSGGAS